MKMAKASAEELEWACRLAGMLGDVDQGRWPRPLLPDDEPDSDAPDWFDEDEPDHCMMLCKRLLAMMAQHPGGLARVVLGMSVLCDPNNKLINQDSESLEIHPSLMEAWQALTADGEEVSDFEADDMRTLVTELEQEIDRSSGQRVGEFSFERLLVKCAENGLFSWMISNVPGATSSAAIQWTWLGELFSKYNGRNFTLADGTRVQFSKRVKDRKMSYEVTILTQSGEEVSDS